MAQIVVENLIDKHHPARGRRQMRGLEVVKKSKKHRLKPVLACDFFTASRPCIRVSDIPKLLANGTSFDEILADYSFFEREDIYAAIEYAAHQADQVVQAK